MRTHTPYFTYDKKKLVERISLFKQFLPNVTITYPVKCNPNLQLLKDLWSQGIKSFDVASLGEMEIVRNLLPTAKLHYTNTIKSHHCIKKAYYDFNIRHFTIDSVDEMHKITNTISDQNGLIIHIRLRTPHDNEKFNFNHKFGISIDHVKKLIHIASSAKHKIGLSFHVGSQCTSTDYYIDAINQIEHLLVDNPDTIKYVNIGGGFPVAYDENDTFDLQEMLATIHSRLMDIRNKFPDIVFLSEPGRLLVAESFTLVTTIQHRRNQYLYLDDGAYGHLHDAAFNQQVYPIHPLSNKRCLSTVYDLFSFFGPTCCSKDFIKGPYRLPKNIQEGDRILFKNMGAYSLTMATTFNGFSEDTQIINE